MRGKRLLWQLYIPYLLITLGSVLAVTLYAAFELRRYHMRQAFSDLESRALLIEHQFREPLSSGNYAQIDQWCKEIGKPSATRITIILASGKVVGDSDEQIERMNNHRNRPEIMEAFAGRIGSSLRYSYTLEKQMAYVAVPVQNTGQPASVVRASVSLSVLNRQLSTIYLYLASGVVGVVVLAAGAAMLLSHRITRPLEQLRSGAERFARGDLGHMLDTEGTQEIEALASTMNQMAAELNSRIATATSQRNEREAILSSMVEGVLAVDSEQRVLHMNQSAADLLGVDVDACRARDLAEIVRSPQLQTLVGEVLAKQESVADEFALFTDQERFLHVQGAVLRASEESIIGALVVLYDVTQIKKLENMRRDFVANVSHELKTPITSIKGYVETLLHDQAHSPGDVERFLRIIADQTDRLNAIIDDLLSLSHVEQTAERAEISMRRQPIKPILTAALEASHAQIAGHDIHVDVTCEDELHAHVNTFLLEQVVTNLIDNACKYSPAGATVWVEAKEVDGRLVIRVRDEGCGIEERHLPRLFERFYRVDKSRSRKLGGTGLGLAIVKHIAQAHQGEVRVESAPGEGSVFSIVIPIGAEQEAALDKSPARMPQ